MIGIIIFLVLLLIVFAQEKLFDKLRQKELGAKIELQKNKLCEGEKNILKIVVTNRKFLPVPTVKVKYNTPKSFKFLNAKNYSVSDKHNKQDVFSLRAYEKITRNLEIICQKRGIYSIKDVSLVSNSPLMSREYIKIIEQKVSVTVFPKVVDEIKISSLIKKLYGEITTKRFSLNKTYDFKNIREYQSTDSLRDINYFAFAKTGEPMVNVYENGSDVNVTVAINLERYTNVDPKNLTEESIRLGAGICSHFIKLGIPVGIEMNSPSVFGNSALSINTSCGENHLENIRMALATVNEEEILFSGDELLKKIKKDKNTFVILISRNCSLEMINSYKESEADAFVVPYDLSGEKPKVDCKNTFFWEVQP